MKLKNVSIRDLEIFGITDSLENEALKENLSPISSIDAAIRFLINDENDAIFGYDKVISMIEKVESSSPLYETCKNLITVLDSIRQEEIIHTGELNSLLFNLNPEKNLNNFNKGIQEVEDTTTTSGNE